MAKTTTGPGIASALALSCSMVFAMPTARADAFAASAPDLSVAAVKHWVQCPLPSDSACVIRKPVDTGYRVLTTGAVLDDTGEQWVADFSKIKAPGIAQLRLRVLARDGELHEIVVRFPDEPPPAAKPVTRKKRRMSKPKSGISG